MASKTKRIAIAIIKHDATAPKSKLMDLMRTLEGIDIKQAEKLGKIIGRLEAWQNS